MKEVSFYVDRKTKVKILEQFNKTERDLEEDVELLKKWFKSQPHLPEIPSDNMLEFFLVNNKFSIEITKQKLDMYYTIRLILPDFFQELNPKTSRNTTNFNYHYFLPLPKLLNDMYRVVLIKIKDGPLEELNVECIVEKAVQVIEVRIQEDLMFSDIVVFDCEHLKMGHVLKFTPMHAKIAVTILERVYSNRIKEIHVINYHPIFDYLLKLAKVLVKPKLYERFRLHKSLDSLNTYVSPEVLPKEYGGNELSLDDLQELWRQKFKEYEDRFDKLDTLKVNEALRPTAMKDLESLEGIGGTFKKLNID